MEQYPDVVDSYFDLLSGVSIDLFVLIKVALMLIKASKNDKTIRRCPSVFFQLPHEMLNTIFCFAIAGMGLQERLALRASLNFMASLFQKVYATQRVMDLSSKIMLGGFCGTGLQGRQ